MNRRQAKKKYKKEQQRLEAYAAAIEQLPDIARRISEGIKEAVDRISEALSQIDIKEISIRLSEALSQIDLAEVLETKKQHATEIITPGNCVACGEPITDDGLLLCQACRAKNKEEQDAAQN